jgi:hypothetical protein
MLPRALMLLMRWVQDKILFPVATWKRTFFSETGHMARINSKKRGKTKAAKTLAKWPEEMTVSASVLTTVTVAIDAYCIGELWKAADEPTLARLIAIMAMGQASYAGHILETLAPAEPAISNAELRAEARIKLTVEEPKKTPRGGYPRWQRDGLIFEAISWLAARQAYPGVLLKTPVCTENLSSGVVVVKSAEDGV